MIEGLRKRLGRQEDKKRLQKEILEQKIVSKALSASPPPRSNDAYDEGDTDGNFYG